MSEAKKIINGQLVDLYQNAIYPAEICIENHRIESIRRTESAPNQWIIPGLVDAHVHIESSMLAPSEFAPLALAQGTIATVSDPHEIANVLGIEGVRWMVRNGKATPFYFHFGAPSCVPATSFETAGAEVNLADIEALFEDGSCQYLAEMMNWPGVIFDDPMVLAKLDLAKRMSLPIDGHAPGLRGEQSKSYFSKGIQTDHECFTLEEGLEKAELGVKILIREGSAARNFEALIPIIQKFPDRVMFCSDDKHPDDLLNGHINLLVRRAVQYGYNLFDVLKAATLNPMEHYNLNCGRLREGDFADFVILDDLDLMTVQEVYIKGESVFLSGGNQWLPEPVTETPNQFKAHFPELNSYKIKTEKNDSVDVRVIEAIEGQLITSEKIESLQINRFTILSDPTRDILKMAVVNRYSSAPPALAFITGFGLKGAAIASSVAHDSHNIVAVGDSDELIKAAVDALMNSQGGICLAHSAGTEVLPLPIAGLMSERDGHWVGRRYEELTKLASQFQSKPKAPFMLLSFMALLVIPALKLSDLGLFNGQEFRFVDLEK